MRDPDKAKRRREQEGRAVRVARCPECGARQGEACTDENGASRKTTHSVRLRMASYAPIPEDRR